MRVVEVDSKRNVGNAYVVSPGEDRERIVRTTCFFGGKDGRGYCVMYDSRMRVLRKPSLFMTVEMAHDSENTRLQASSAMKLLCSFVDIVGIGFDSFGLAEARAFMQFARGMLSDGVGFTFELKTARAEATVAAYLKTMRRYASYLELADSPFLKEAGRLARSGVGERNGAGGKLLAARKPEPFEAPHYITVEQYRLILAVIDRGWGLEERSICRLMFEHGLRIGEVLGLTLEDLESSVDGDGMLHYAVVIRNRASDKPWQKAKTLMSVSSANQYGSADYRKRNLGVHRVYVSESAFADIAAYAEESRAARGFDAHACAADSVSGGENQYLFCNGRSRPLSSNLWNKRLRAIMTEAGVPVDKETRKTNLNHRFRHGYAMFLTRQCGMDAYEVKTLMRHRSIASTEVYHKPTEEDVRDLQGEVIAEFEGFLLGGSDG